MDELPTQPNVDLASLEAALLDAQPGLEILARGLELDGLRTDAVGVDAEGRLNLLLFVDGQDQGLPLTVLDSLRVARRQRLLLARHLGEPRLDAEADARVIVAAEGYDALVLERLACLPAHQVSCFELHELRSDRGSSTLLLPAVGEAGQGPAAESRADSFLDDLGGAQRELASELAQRLERLDPEVSLAAGPGGLEWRFRGEPLCRLREEEGRLVGSVVEGPSQALAGTSDLEGFLDAGLRRYLALLDSLASGASTGLSAAMSEA